MTHYDSAGKVVGMNQSATTPPEKRPIDWEAVEIQYRCGIRSLKSIGDEFGVSDAGIIKRAKRDGWARDLNAKIQAAAEQKVSAALVSAVVSDGKKVSERVAIEIGSDNLAEIRFGHRKSTSRLQSIITAQMEELEVSSGIELSERTKIAKQLSETLRIAIDLERREFGMDKTQVNTDPLTELIKRISTSNGSAFTPVAVDPAYSGGDE